ncbi:Lipoprotein-anchoring transpeptidase ErfK/SrfK [Sphingobium sp. AP50]|uniref:L,D-transpeptidase family protein n=1 Tax=Sphingobium sp. AP50 TaxID=1884369 RepID=UPI0008C91453|nr:L,D-transpeptidase family protein [Sphingobium sp. AP50]SEK07158.1 Lipoprotein-anchoring transpeptidase ErfK/SrfK [Sphingobium sp. AP50]
MQSAVGAQVPNPAATPASAFRATNIDPSIFRAQVQLDRAGFGPGVIDGRKGRFFNAAVKGYQAAQGLTQSGELDGGTRAALGKDDAPALMTMVLKDDALAADFTPDIPAKIVDQVALPNLGYRDIVERLAERFHTTPQILLALNPALKAPQAGMELRLPSLIPANRDYDNSLSPQWRDTLATLNISARQPQAAKIVVDKSESLLKVFDAQDRLVAQFPATTGSDHDPLPIGQWVIEAIAFLPTYHYNPDLFWDAAESDGTAVLQPGPNNPVGVVWIDLDKPHYGIHGTPEPTRIGRSQSHGCVRLSNWDAARLAQMTSTSTQVIFQE